MDSKESKTSSWFNRFIGREQKPDVVWPFPFIEGKLFILTIRAGLDGYHISVGGRHISSFLYRPVCFFDGVINMPSWAVVFCSICCMVENENEIPFHYNL